VNCVALCIVCVVLCIVCVYMCTVLLPQGVNPITVKYIISLRDQHLRFSQLQCLRFKLYVMWCHIIWWIITNVSDDRNTFKTLGTTCPKTEHHIPEYLNLWHRSYLNYTFLIKILAVKPK
jgi:hypothetical protein